MAHNAGEGKMFSPGNLRATFDNAAYERLISYYVGEKYTLRYTGGMVPGEILSREKQMQSQKSFMYLQKYLRLIGPFIK